MYKDFLEINFNLESIVAETTILNGNLRTNTGKGFARASRRAAEYLLLFTVINKTLSL